MNKITFNDLRKKAKENFPEFNVIKLAILGDSATQLLKQSIKGYGFYYGINFDIYEADFNQIEIQTLDASSALYDFRPEFVIISFNSAAYLNKFGYLSVAEKKTFAVQQKNNIENIINSINTQLDAKILLFNFCEFIDPVFGNFSNKTEFSFLYQIRKLNFEIMNLSNKVKNLFVIDINSLQSEYGKDFIFDTKLYYTSNIVWKLDFLPVLSKNILDVINALKGNIKKCLIFDLDNTIWGGIIGDDGMEKIEIGELGIGKVFTEIQLWIKQLKYRGIILAVCSKNNENIAKEPFVKHPDMILKLSDISVFVANWKNKADNIGYIQKVLNIGFDSMVFLDDSPFERQMVRENIPEITVPELPPDPAEYLKFLRRSNLFETGSFSPEDHKRTQRYREEAKRAVLKEQFADEDKFLLNLNMKSAVESFNGFNIPRVAQLTQRSNQFNLRTIRYTEQDIYKLSVNRSFINLAFSLKDKFGHYGIISVVILKKENNSTLFIDTWIMSCRVLNRTMENFIMNIIVEKAKENNFTTVIGEYLPTKKNSLVKNLYEKLGFTKNENVYILKTDNYNNLKTYIEKE